VFTDDDESQRPHLVVLNHEEQYSIWPSDRDIPAGWRREGTEGTMAECLAHIDEVWTDMRPLSLRLYMENQERLAAERGDESEAEQVEEEEETLVSRLSRGQHEVELSLQPEPTGTAARDAIERGYVFVRFTGTRGGTELGVRLDREATDVRAADFDAPSGTVHLVGDLNLDFEPVRCVVDIDLTRMAGHGHLATRTPSG
jgi:uncharacterized protein YbdZ (MbtH family)